MLLKDLDEFQSISIFSFNGQTCRLIVKRNGCIKNAQAEPIFRNQIKAILAGELPLCGVSQKSVLTVQCVDPSGKLVLPIDLAILTPGTNPNYF